jgi:hypothetical protein
MTLSRLNGSVTPLRFSTSSAAVSVVVNRRLHAGQERRRRTAAPSSAGRLSRTRLSSWAQNGQRMSNPPVRGDVARAATGATVVRDAYSIGLRYYL